MDGEPVWLASLSRWDESGSLATSRWTKEQMQDGMAGLASVLDGVGDATRQRFFRMQLTLCMHKAASAEEKAALPSWFWTDPGVGIAGGPVEVLSETVPGKPSVRPCENPGRRWLNRPRDNWIPIDCGACDPCRARELCGTYEPIR